MGNNQIKDSGARRFANLASAPSPAAAGLTYWDTVAQKLRLHNGSAFVSVADLTVLASSTGPSGASLIGVSGTPTNFTPATPDAQAYFDAIDTALGAAAGNTFSDSLFRVYDNGDSTKRIALEASGISTATTRTIIMPDANVDLGNLTNSNISASAAIAYSKLNLTGSIVNADINAAAAIVYSKLSLSNSIVNADINASAAIAYSKLNLSASIVNADIAAGAAIAYSKLNLTGNIVNADINASAAIAYSKLAALTANRALQSDGSGFVSVSAVTNTELGYVSGVTSAIQTQLNARALDSVVIKKDGSVAFTGDQSMGNNKLTNLADPVSALDAANKQYVDALQNGLSWKHVVRVASTANVVIASALEAGDVIDGITLVAGDRVLLKDQTLPAQNGIYVASASGAASRSTDMDSWAEVVSAAAFISEGTVNADKAFVCTSDAGGTLGTTAITFVQFSSFGSFTAGSAIDISGTTISVKFNNTNIGVNGSNQLEVKSGSLTNTEISASAAIAYSKLNLSASIVNADIAAGAAIAYSKLNLSASIVNADISASAAIVYSKLSLTNSIVNADINASAAIAYSKLALSNSIVNADINASAAIAYSKLNLSASIVNADIAAGAAIARNKLAALTANRALVSDGSGFDTVSATTATQIGYLSTTTSDVQVQIDSKVTGPASATDNAVARFDGTTGKLVQDSLVTSSDLGGLTIQDIFARGDNSSANVVEEEYVHNATLTASTTAVLAALTFDGRTYKSLQIDYMVKNGNDRRTGNILVVCNNASGVAPSTVSIVDTSSETADINLDWSAAVNGNNIELSYTTSSGTYRLNADLKRFLAN